MIAYQTRTTCGLCASTNLERVISFASTPLANEFVKVGEPSDPHLVPLTLGLCKDCLHIQLMEIVDPKRLFENYVYVSGTSPVFVRHLHELAKSCIERFELPKDSFIVDIGSNDGTLLRQFQLLGRGNVLGIDPAQEIAFAAMNSGIPTMCRYFSSAVGREIRGVRGPADLVTANNVFAHVQDLKDFAKGVSLLLDAEGVFVFEVSYFVEVLDKLMFDTIYHEHLAYHTLAPLRAFFESLGMRLFDAETITSHGGSLRCFVSHKAAEHRDTERLGVMLLREIVEIDWASEKTYYDFAHRIATRAQQLRAHLKEYSFGSVAGYGAPAKLTTLMFQFDLEHDQFSFIIDDSPLKQGLVTPGLRIPVVPSSMLLEEMPEAVVIFAWNFADTIIQNNSEYLKQGGTFIVPLPEFRIVTADSDTVLEIK